MNQELLLVIRAQNQAQAQLNQLRGNLAGLGAQVKTTTAAARTMNVGFASLWQTFKQLMPLLAVMKLFQELKQAIGNATRAAIEFGEALHNLWTLTDMAKGSLFTLGGEIRALARQYNTAATDATRAMYQIYSATFYAKDAFIILEESIKGAVAGLSDVFNVADMMTTVLNAWRMSASETAYVNDLLFTTIKYGKTTMSELAHQFGRLAGVAAPAGASIAEMTAAIATLTRQGIATDWAITSLRQTLMQTLRPGSELAAVIKNLGFESGRALISTLGFSGAIKSIAAYARANGLAMENLFTNVRAVTAVLPLATTAAGEFVKDLDRMANAAGAAAIAMGKQKQAAAFQIGVLRTAIKDASITIGNTFVPTLKMLLTALNAIIQPLAHVASIFFEFGGGMMVAAVSGIAALSLAMWGLHKALVAINVQLAIRAASIGLSSGAVLAGIGTAAIGGLGLAMAVKGGIEIPLLFSAEVSGIEKTKTALKLALGPIITAAMFGGPAGLITAGIAGAAGLVVHVIHEVKAAQEAAASAREQAVALIESNIDILPKNIGWGTGLWKFAEELAKLDPEFEKLQGSTYAMKEALTDYYDAVGFMGLAGHELMLEHIVEQRKAYSGLLTEGENVNLVLKTFEDQLGNLHLVSSDYARNVLPLFSESIEAGSVEFDSFIRSLKSGELTLDQTSALLERMREKGDYWNQAAEDLIVMMDENAPVAQALAERYATLLDLTPSLEQEIQMLVEAFKDAEEGSYEQAIATVALAQKYGLLTDASSFLSKHTDITEVAFQGLIDTILELLPALSQAQSAFKTFIDGLEYSTPQEAVQAVADIINEMKTGGLSIQDMLLSGQSVESIQGLLQGARTGLYRTNAGGINSALIADVDAALAELATMIGKTPEEIQAELDKAKQVADKAARDAATAAAKALSEAQTLFRQQFADPKLGAIVDGDWLGAAEAINAIAADKDALIAKGAGLDIDAAEVLSLIAGMESDLTGALDEMIQLGFASQETADMLKEYFNPTVIYTMEQLREGVEGLKFSEEAEKARDLISEQEQLIEDLKFFGFATEDAEIELLRLRAAAEDVTIAALKWRDALSEIGNTIKDGFKDLISGLFGTLFDVGEKAKQTISSSNIPAGFKTLRAAWGVAKAGQPWGQDKEGEEGFSLKDWLIELAEGLVATLSDLLGEWLWEQIVEIFKAIGAETWKWIVKQLTSIYDTVLGWLLNLFGPASLFGISVASVGAALATIATALFGLGLVIGTIVAVFAFLWGAIQGIGDLISAFLKPIIEAVGWAWKALTPLIEGARVLFGSLAPIMSIFGEIVAFGIKLITPLFSALGVALQIAGGIIRIVADGIKWVWDNTLGFVLNALAVGLGWLANIVIGVYNIFASILNFLDPFGNPFGKIDPIDLNSYHSGGIVQGIAGQEIYGKLMPGELVVTQQQQQQGYGGGGTLVTGNTFILPNVTDPESFKREFSNMTTRGNLRATGNRFGPAVAQGLA